MLPETLQKPPLETFVLKSVSSCWQVVHRHAAFILSSKNVLLTPPGSSSRPGGTVIQCPLFDWTALNLDPRNP